MKETMMKLVQDYFDGTQDNENEKAYQTATAENYEKIINLHIPKQGRDLEEMLQVLKEDVFPYRVVGEHKRSFAFVPAPVQDISKLGDVMTTLYNANAAGWFSAPIIAQIDKQLIEWLCQRVGYGEGAGGIFVSGGSLANLTCIIAARDDKLELDDIGKGVAYVSAQAHHSVNKALRMVGIPDSRIRKVETDEAMRMKPESLDQIVKEDKEKGLIPFIVIATAGTTNAGTIDPLADLAQVAKKHNLWLHIDAAFGASVLVSQKYRGLLAGIEEADSVIWDAHKWLYQTYTCAVALVKKQSSLLKSFSDNPSYLKDVHSSQVDSWDLGPELSRPALGVKLWLTLQTLGTEAIASDIDYNIELAKEMEQIVLEYPNWKVVTEASLGMLTFAYQDETKTQEELDTLHTQICNEITESGFANILTTEIDGRKVIRICTISPQTTKEDMQETMETLNSYALKLV